MNWWQTLASLILGGGSAGIAGSLLKDLLQRPKVKADAVLALTDAAVKQVNELQEQVTETRGELTQTRSELEQARRQVRSLTLEIDECMRTMRMWRTAIFSPVATIDGLRAMVGPEPGTNGTSP